MSYTQNPRTKDIVINKLSDFPQEVSGDIVLESASYIINTQILCPYTLTIPTDAQVDFVTNVNAPLVYTGTGTFINSTDLQNGIIQFLGSAISCPSGGTLFGINTNDVVNDKASIISQKSSFSDIADLGAINGVNTFVNFSQFLDCGNGMKLSNINEIGLQGAIFRDWKNNTTDMIDISGSNGDIQIANISCSPKSNECFLNIDSASTTAVGSVSNCIPNLSNGGDFLNPTSIGHTNIYWSFEGNVGQKDSTALGTMYFTNGTEITTNLVIGQFIKVNHASWSLSNAERFTFDASGRLTYIGLEDLTVQIIFRGTLEAISPPTGLKELAVNIAKNGTVVTNGLESAGSTQTGNTTSVTSVGTIGLVTNDYLEMFATNNTDTTGLYVRSAQFSIIKL